MTEYSVKTKHVTELKKILKALMDIEKINVMNVYVDEHGEIIIHGGSRLVNLIDEGELDIEIGQFPDSELVYGHELCSLMPSLKSST